MASLNKVASQLGRLRALIRLTPFSAASTHGRSRERYRRALITGLTTSLARVVQIGASLLIVPLVIGYLGKEQYGIYATITSLLPVLVLIHRAIGNGLVQAISAAEGRDDRAELRGYVATTCSLFVVAAVSVLCLFYVFYDLIPWSLLFNVSNPEVSSSIGPAVAALVVTFSLNMILGVVPLVHAGMQEGFINSVVSVAGTVLSCIGVVAVIQGGFGLASVVAVWTGGNVVPIAVEGGRLLITRQWLRFGSADVSFRAARRVLRTGGYLVVAQLALVAAPTADFIVGNQLLGPAEMAEYAVASKLFVVIQMPLTLFLSPFWPSYSEALARGEGAWVKRALARTTLVALIAGTVLGLIATLGGGTIIRLWVGEVVQPSVGLLAGLAAWTVASVVGTNLTFFLAAARDVRVPALLSALMFLLSLGARFVFVEQMGVSGLPWATVLTYLLAFLCPLSLYMRARIVSLVGS